MKVLWQTLENGDVGDPVLGVVNSAADHTNIVDIVRMMEPLSRHHQLLPPKIRGASIAVLLRIRLEVVV